MQPSLSDNHYVIGVDVGGTFTDACAIGADGAVWSAKVPTTPPDYGDGVVAAIGALASQREASPSDLLANTSHICHGTTATLNALVMHDVAPVGLVTTKGHRDSLAIMNVEGKYLGLDSERVQDMLNTHKPQPLLAPERIVEINERIDSAGAVVVPAERDATRDAIQRLLDTGVQAFAVSLLWSFLNPDHEQLVRELIHAAAPEAYVALSSEVSPRIGEFARAATTTMSAQVGPRLAGYLEALDERLTSEGFTGRLMVMQGNGGLISAEEAVGQAIGTIGSVLTGGVIGASIVANQLEQRNVIATDMGGTTFLVGMIVDGAPLREQRAIVGQYPVNVPMVQIHTIGSGGGAIAHLDPGGNLRVGPESAQAVPGPACYGAGGVEPTITDADLVLGILNPAGFLGGRVQLQVELARRAISERIADPLGLDVEQAAMAIHAVANAQMTDAIRQVVVSNGYDPRDFMLYAYGGAAPMHVAGYAGELGIQEILVPLGATAAAFSAYGLAGADIVLSTERSSPSAFPLDATGVNAIFDELHRAAALQLEAQHLKLDDVAVEREVDVRYSLQLAEVPVSVHTGALTQADIDAITTDFERQYERIYGAGTGFAGAGYQAITYRVHVRGRMVAQAELPALPGSSVPGRLLNATRSRDVFLDVRCGPEVTAIYGYDELHAGDSLDGPAVVEAPTTTVVVPRGWRGRVDRLGNLRLSISDSAAGLDTPGKNEE